MKTRLIALLMLGALALPTAAPATPPAITLDMQKDVMVTIYNGNLGLVKDVREIRLPAGTTDVQFMDVAALIGPHHRPPQVDHRSGRPQDPRAELRVRPALERQADGEVRRQARAPLSARRQLSRGDAAQHQRPRLRDQRPDPSGSQRPSDPARLAREPRLAADAGLAPAQPGDRATARGGLVLDERHHVAGDYVLVLNPADMRGDLTGWVTIDNKSGAIYRNAALKLVAGDVNRAVDRFRDVKALEMAARAPATAEARRDFQSEGFFEYHLYTLDGRTTIKDNQTKQLSLLAA